MSAEIFGICVLLVGCRLFESLYSVCSSISASFVSLPTLNRLRQSPFIFHFWILRTIFRFRQFSSRENPLKMGHFCGNLWTYFSRNQITIYFVASCMRLMPVLFAKTYLTVEGMTYIRTVDIGIYIGVQILIGRYVYRGNILSQKYI